MPLWKAFFGCLALAAIAIIVVLIKLSVCTIDGEKTVDVPDSPIDLITPESDSKLDVFRSDWDILGRFEQWPALLPLAEMSNTAYDLEPDVSVEFRRLGFDTTAIVNSPLHSQVAYIACGGDVMVVVFRGTDETEDWFSNINIYRRGMDEGDIHSGFSGAYSMLRSEVQQQIADHSPKHLWITGHSLGGAMALVCAYDLLCYGDQDIEIEGVITFGQPKIGDKRLTDYLQEKIGNRYVHFVNELDAVPRMPNSLSHCGLLLRFFRGRVQKSEGYFQMRVGATEGQSNGEASIEDGYEPINELPELSPEEKEAFRNTYRGDKLPANVPLAAAPSNPNDPSRYGDIPWKDDHSMDRYVEKVRSAIEKATRN